MSESLLRASGKAVSMGDMTALERVAFKLNWVLERVCAALMAALILIIWLGVFDRYIMQKGLTWTEELSRYIMIWGALLAVPCAAYYREHIGLELFLARLSLRH